MDVLDRNGILINRAVRLDPVGDPKADTASLIRFTPDPEETIP